MDKTDFLRFNAYSIKELITRKLSQDTKFTDQVYEGSNLAVLIDIVSYMYQCLVYQLNNAASESMFSDTQIYENMVRLVKFLDYNPRGCNPSNVIVQFTEKDQTNWKPLPFTSFSTGKTDSQGKEIFFSTGTVLDSDPGYGTYQTKMYNGKWRLYNTIHTASGVENEKIELNGLKSDSEANEYVANDFIKIFIAKQDGTFDGNWTPDTDGIFMSTSAKIKDTSLNDKYVTMYDNSSKKYSIQLTQNKSYEIRFGDGIVGQRLTKGDMVYILYLDTNGPEGQIDIGDVDISKQRIQAIDGYTGLPDNLLNAIYGISGEPTKSIKEKLREYGENEDYEMQFYVGTSTQSTSFEKEEGVEQLRKNSPNWFKTGNRLVTKKDYEYFIKYRLQYALNNQQTTGTSNIGNDEGTYITNVGKIIDAKCMNNIEYVTSFYKWLYLQGLKHEEPDGQYYLRNDTNNFFSRTNYSKIDPSDSNNVYIWLKGENEYSSQDVDNITQQVQQALQNIKNMTAEITIVRPIAVNFDICAADSDYVVENLMYSEEFDQNIESYIEITLNDDVTFVGNSIQQRVCDIIMDAFDQNNIMLGQVVDTAELVNSIYEINGVKRVRTVWSNESGDTKVIDGLSFASWTDTEILEQYEDIQVGNNTRHVEDFQYPRFIGSGLLYDRIRIIKKQLNVVNTLKF